MVKMGDVWDRTVEFLGERLSTILPVAVLALLVPASLTGSVGGVPIGGVGARAAASLIGIAFAVLSLWGRLAITALAIDPTDARAARRAATVRLLPAIGVYLFAFVVLFVVLGGQAMAFAFAGGYDLGQITAAGQTMQRLALPPGVGARLGIVLLLETLALLFVFARLMPINAVVLAERQGLAAFARAFRLTKGLSWKLVGVALLYAVLSFVTAMAAQTVFGSILRLLTSSQGPVSTAGVVTAVAVATVGTAFSVVGAAFGGKLYAAILRLHEARALATATATAA